MFLGDIQGSMVSMRPRIESYYHILLKEEKKIHPITGLIMKLFFIELKHQAEFFSHA